MEKAKINVNERFCEYLSMYGNEELIPMLDEQTRLKMGQGKRFSSAMLNQSLLRSVGCYELDGPLSEPLFLHRHRDPRRGRGQGSGDSLREETEQSRWCLQAWVVDL